jgi:hypothetical protein
MGFEKEDLAMCDTLALLFAIGKAEPPSQEVSRAQDSPNRLITASPPLEMERDAPRDVGTVPENRKQRS